MKRIIVLIALLFLTTSITNIHPKPSGCLTVDIAILLDWSGSENGFKKPLLSAVNNFIEGLPISEYNVRMSLISFNNDAYMMAPLTGNKDILDSGLYELMGQYPGGVQVSVVLWI